MNKPTATIVNADCIEWLRSQPENSIDAIVTDPPYGIGFSAVTGKNWDDAPPGEEWARECLRVLKPGGHILAFGASRTWHRLAVAIEDGGFEIRDSIAWIYGSGMGKSLNISKAIDKGQALSKERAYQFTEWMRSTGITAQKINELTKTNMGSHYLSAASQPAVPTPELFDLLRDSLPEVPEEIEDLVSQRTGNEWADWKARESTGVYDKQFSIMSNGEEIPVRQERKDIPSTEAAAKWEGWYTALRPAFEPVVVGRKPMDSTVAQNVLEYGTGGLNLGATMVGDGFRKAITQRKQDDSSKIQIKTHTGITEEKYGRLPTNVILGEDAAAELDELTPLTKASKFFYSPKASQKERPYVDGTIHPTVKPLNLMRYLIRLVTPPGGVVLDTFTGSGATVEAALMEGFDVIGVERDADYIPLINARIDRYNGLGNARPSDRDNGLHDIFAED